MVTVRFTIDGDEREVELEGDHPNQVYRKGDVLVEKIEQLGYEYTASPPTVQDLADADRMTREGGVIGLGELDDSVRKSGSSGPADHEGQ